MMNFYKYNDEILESYGSNNYPVWFWHWTIKKTDQIRIYTAEKFLSAVKGCTKKGEI